jgi:uncharacterized protein (DUF927 family)
MTGGPAARGFAAELRRVAEAVAALAESEREAAITGEAERRQIPRSALEAMVSRVVHPETAETLTPPPWSQAATSSSAESTSSSGSDSHATAEDLSSDAAGKRSDAPDGDARENVAPTFRSVGDFEMTREGLFAPVGTGRDRRPQLISAPFEIIGRARDPRGNGWGRMLRWRDADGRDRSLIVTDAALHHDAATLAATLADKGLRVVPRLGSYLACYLDKVEVARRLTVVNKTGWHEVAGSKCFVLPGRTIGGPASETVMLDVDAATARYEAQGDVAKWQASVGAMVENHGRLVFTVSAAFAGPLLSSLRAEGGGIHLVGLSSIGKTTAAAAAASVWGRGTVSGGYVQNWHATANSLEGEAARHNDTLYVVDEIGVADAREVAPAVYQLASGSGKGRAGRDGQARQRISWRVWIISTGEVGLADKLAEDKRRHTAGQAVRLLDIPADAGRGCGCFDHPGPTGNAKDLADQIRGAAQTDYGSAGPAFVEKLVERMVAEGVDDVVADIRDTLERLRGSLIPAGADGQVQRAAERFALIGVAGELAIALGVVPWRAGFARSAAEACFRAWLDKRGGLDAHEVTAAIAQVRRIIERDGESRFQRLDNVDVRPISNRLGYTRGEGINRQWWVLPEMWKAEVCAGFDPVMVAKVLADRGMLLPDSGGKFSCSETIDGRKRRVYVLTSAILGGD